MSSPLFVKIEPDQIRSIFTTGIVAKANSDPRIALIPKKAQFYHPLGVTPYTIVGFTSLNIYVGTVALIAAGNPGLDAVAEFSIIMRGPGSAAALFSGSNLLTFNGQPITIKATGANPAGAGDFPLTVLITYEEELVVPSRYADQHIGTAPRSMRPE